MKISKRKARVLIIGAVSLVIIFSLYLIFSSSKKGDAKLADPAPQPSKDASSSGSSTNLKYDYKLVMHESAVAKIENYKARLAFDSSICGESLRHQLSSLFKGVATKDLTTNQFIEALLATKTPEAYAASLNYGPKENWSAEDTRLLGNINVVMPVKVFDNGIWKNPKVHATPFYGYLMYTPGALLQKSCDVDYSEVIKSGVIDDDAYMKLYERRLLPMLHFANDESLAKGKKAIVTTPGIGCGVFSGSFGTEITSKFNAALKKILAKHAANFPNISLVYFGQKADDDKAPGEFEAENFDGIKYRRIDSNHANFQNLLEPPEKFKIDATEDYSNHLLFALVAWSHLSLPGNGFFANCRGTDDGVKAAATSSMSSLLGVEGEYHPSDFKFKPKATPNTNWKTIANNTNFRLRPTEDHLYVLKTQADGKPVLTNK